MTQNGQSDETMSTPSWRFRVASACALAFALGWSGAAAAGNSLTPANPSASTVAGAAHGGPPSERGVVQSVSASGLVLKTLDGSTVAAAVSARTRVLIDGKPASILDVHPGFVAVVSFRGGSGQAALEVDAFTTSPSLPARVESAAGVVRSVSRSALVLTALDGAAVSVGVDAATRVLVDGKPASILDVRPGFVAVVRPEARAGNGRGKKAGELRKVFAFAPARQRGAHLYIGAVASVSVHAIALRARSGGTFRVALAAKTVVFVDGTRGSIRDVAPGDVAVARTGSRYEVWAFGAPRAAAPGT